MLATDSKPSQVTIPYALHSAASALRLSREEIIHQHESHPVALSDRTQNGIKQHCVEVRFENLHADLMCLFDEKMQCYSTFIFFDEGCSIESYVDFLNQNYSYNYLKSWWTMPGCNVAARKMKGEVCLCFIKTQV